jgi:phage-related protein
MYEIYFYEDKSGDSPVFDYIQALSQHTDKDSRINYNKIIDYIQALAKTVKRRESRSLSILTAIYGN